MGKQKRRNIKIEGCTGQSQKCNLLAEDVFTDVSVEYDDYMWNCEYSTIDIDDLDRCIQRLSEELYEVNQRIEEVEQFKRAKIDHADIYAPKSHDMELSKEGIPLSHPEENYKII
ncbi:hypothetical protein evm_011542 [Chilo suppressalis]|nr:hypothetical protein evm_011542 [Chilo suppressalis]